MLTPVGERPEGKEGEDEDGKYGVRKLFEEEVAEVNESIVYNVNIAFGGLSFELTSPLKWLHSSNTCWNVITRATSHVLTSPLNFLAW